MIEGDEALQVKLPNAENDTAAQFKFFNDGGMLCGIANSTSELYTMRACGVALVQDCDRLLNYGLAKY